LIDDSFILIDSPASNAHKTNQAEEKHFSLFLTDCTGRQFIFIGHRWASVIGDFVSLFLCHLQCAIISVIAIGC
jgi:hypothetical protein